jgi:CRP/FNR family transcriptional regulator
MRPDSDLRLADSQNAVINACSEETRTRLFEGGDIRALAGSELLLREGDPAGFVLFTLNGALQMSKTALRGRRQILCTPESGCCQGICMLTLSDQSLADISAQRPSRVLLAPRALFQALARSDQALCQAGWNSAAACMSHLSGLVEALSFHKVSERIALLLLEETQRDGDLVRLTQAGVAAQVGTTREVVARCLAGLQTVGGIRLGRGRITVLSRSKLEQYT